MKVSRYADTLLRRGANQRFDFELLLTLRMDVLAFLKNNNNKLDFEGLYVNTLCLETFVNF